MDNRRIRPKSKYGNKKATVDGVKFDSKLEALRYANLKLLERAGEISELKRQVPFSIEVNGCLVCKYIADFTYLGNGKHIVEDAKGVLTDTFKLKSKLMKAVLGIDILITKKSTSRL